MAEAGVRAFLRITERWGVTSERDLLVLLGGVSRSTLSRWKAGQIGRVSHDTLERLSFIAGIYKALQVLLQEPGRADTWPNRPNRAFGGQTPLERMLGGSITDLASVRAYLDAARGWS
ncbi:MAG: DUF2384 domain-containing protein [Deltaproteobacteria bacterium]|nr:DUF2384 domain-containing protein [Deltaproteobacteria bacterium]